ncbi:MAG: bifunctional phosphopantothenoylcysteine decarboxylase/phosphopantothenate--cysteine ligase CoaBC [Actinobacteria bacterium]|nr:bifunctional phosphopantothenoylcysteine decarboxylase/phosphopantothenate--cysteine ligase CoaBC [Actinomycetota bacterium]
MAEDPGGSFGGRRVLLGVTGGIAAYKACLLARLLSSEGAAVQVIMTEAATRFVGPATFEALTGRPVRLGVFENSEQVLHVKLARAADLAIVAPATANTIAKLALGLADDLLTSTLLEATCPLVVAPAMHSGMLEHPATAEHLRTLAGRGVAIVGPESGALAAGDEGPGRMSEPELILAAAERALGAVRDLEGLRVLVTAGPTHEPIDPVRYLGNRSTGLMGLSIAENAVRRGADVVLVAGPTSAPVPARLKPVRVETAEEMRRAVIRAADTADAVVMAAAVADFRPSEQAGQKLKKESGPPRIELVPTADILKELGQGAGDQVLVGFAAETQGLEEAAQKKLVDKNADLIVGNLVGAPGTGFGSRTNRALIVTRHGEDLPLREYTKDELANVILDRVRDLVAGRRPGRDASEPVP